MLTLFFPGTYSQTWKNPVILNEEWPAYGIGDPYILKHRGVYYLYPSTKNNETGIKCWSSRNLLDWKYEGFCTQEPVTRTAYAPEVIYWNGTFYMYTSPNGGGHYVLSSTSPTGPFAVKSSNVGKTIDGSVFIDDNAQWYFYHASDQGILGCRMLSPILPGADINVNAKMNNQWTEGPCAFKRNGVYYIIYTGNHVISRGYRIDYGSGTSGPLSQFTPATKQNPVLISTMGTFSGLGHGSVFVGPDLDSYFITYHNLVSPNGPYRHFNIDRIAWNNDKMLVLGPTNFEQETPALPKMYDYFDRAKIGDNWTFPDGGKWKLVNNDCLAQDTAIAGSENWFKAINSVICESDYIAEYNFRFIRQDSSIAQLGGVFGYTDEQNYGVVLISSFTNQLIVKIKKDNSWQMLSSVDIPADIDFGNWHSIRLEKSNHTYRVFLDGMLIANLVSGFLNGGQAGYISDWSHAQFGYIALSNDINGSGIFNAYKPVPGNIEAIHFIKGGEGIAYHESDPSEPGENFYRSDQTSLVNHPDGGFAVGSFETGEWMIYNVNVKTTGLFNLGIHYASEQPGTKIRIWFDNTDVSGEVSLSATASSSTWRTHVVKDLDLQAGYHQVKIEVVSGQLNLYRLIFDLADNVAFDKISTFNGVFGSDWKYSDGTWNISSGVANVFGYGKRTFGSQYWRDYTVETDINFIRNMNSGLIFRVTNPSTGGAGNDPGLGTDFLQGYFAGFNYGSIVLGKHNYNWNMLASAPGTFITGIWYHLRVVINDNRIRIYLDDKKDPAIDYTDSDPIMNGMAGLRSFNSGVQFDNFRVTSEILSSSEENPVIAEEKPYSMFPNPATTSVNLSFPVKDIKKAELIGINGKLLRAFPVYGSHIRIPLDGLVPGLYLIRLTGSTRLYTEKLIISTSGI